MSKYEVGDKFIIELGDVYEKTTNGTTEKLYTIKPFNGLAFSEVGLSHLHRVEDYKATIKRKDEEIERLKDTVRTSDYMFSEVYAVTEHFADEDGLGETTSIIALYEHIMDADAHATVLTELKEIEGDTQYEYTVESWAVKRSLKDNDTDTPNCSKLLQTRKDHETD